MACGLTLAETTPSRRLRREFYDFVALSTPSPPYLRSSFNFPNSPLPPIPPHICVFLSLKLHLDPECVDLVYGAEGPSAGRYGHRYAPGAFKTVRGAESHDRRRGETTRVDGHVFCSRACILGSNSTQVEFVGFAVMGTRTKRFNRANNNVGFLTRNACPCLAWWCSACWLRLRNGGHERRQIISTQQPVPTLR